MQGVSNEKKQSFVRLALMLVFTMTAVGCGEDSTDGEGHQWVPATDKFAEPFTGILSNNGTILTVTDWFDNEVIFTKTGRKLNGVWLADSDRLTISGNKNWIWADNVLAVEETNTPVGGSPKQSVSRDSGGAYSDFAKGTLTVNGTTITFTTTHIDDERIGTPPPEVPSPF